MFYLILGMLAGALMISVGGYVRRRKLRVRWWGWFMASLWFLYTLLVAATIYTLFSESAGRAALISCVVFGVPSVVMAVLLARFVFSPARGKPPLAHSSGRSEHV
ncbi:MAG: hypothetical protein FJY80_10300 [Candidatus Aminicenantes bacterium]|nr:hypothetical protein [Candidatus Aminicenantes bacterium]